MKQITFLISLVAAFVAPHFLWAQTGPETHAQAVTASPEKRFYRLEFTVKQIEAGRVINSRNYSMMLGDQQRTSMRSGTRVPFKHGGNPDYLDIGLNIDCERAVETNGQLSLHLKAELTSLAKSPEDNSAEHNPGELPALRQNSWESDVVFPLRKATTLFSSDDLASKQNVQLEVLAIPIK